MSQILEYIKIALMNIKTNKGRSILTMLGIIIGISSVIMLISIGNTIKSQINEELNNMAGGQVYLYSGQQDEEGKYMSFTEEDFELIQDKVAHVKGVTPSWNFWGGTIQGRKGDFNAQITGGNEHLEYSSSEPIVKGKYFTRSDYDSANDVCVISESGAKLLFGNTNVVGMEVELTLYNVSRELMIVGVRKDSASTIISAMNNMGDTVILEVPFTVFSNYGFYIGDVDGFYLIADSAEHSTQAAQDAIQILEAKYGIRGENLIQVDDFNDYMVQISSILNYITIFVSFVAAISLLVGGIGVMNIMLVSVTERTKEIGIRKALGARTASIMMQFLSESAIITLVGGLIGIMIGIGGAVGICSLVGFSADVNPLTILIATIFSSGVGIFFGIYPARKAAKLSPIEALRHE